MPPSNDSQCWPVGHAVQPTPQAWLLLGHIQAPSEHTEFGDAPLFVQSVQTPLFPHAVWVLGHVQAPSEHTEFGDAPLFVQSVQTPLFPHAVWVLGHAVGGHVLLIHSEAPLASSQY